MSGSTRLIFSGKKSFWKLKKVISIDILLIQHCPVRTIEVIAYNAELKCEASHLYVREDALLQRLDSSQWGLDRAKVDFIFDRIVVSSYVPESSSFEVDLTFALKEAALEELLIEKPLGLVAYTSPFTKSSRAPVEAPVKTPPKSPHRTSSGTALDSPRSEQLGIAESNLQLKAKEAADGVAPSHLGEGNYSSSASRLALSTTEVEAAYGAPPRPLCGLKSSSSSPNNANPSGTPYNPRIVPRSSSRSPSTTSHGAKTGFPSASLIPSAPMRMVSASAPSSPYHSRSPSPQSSPRPPQQPILRSLSSTFSTLGFFSATATAAGDAGADCPSDDENDIIGLSLDADEPVTLVDAIACDSQLLTTGTGKVVVVKGTPPLDPRSIANTESSLHLAAAAWASKRATKEKERQRRHTYDPADAAPHLHTTSAHTTTAASTESPRKRLLGMRDALHSLRFPWQAGAAVGGGNKHSKGSKVSPSVSMQALDQLELETRPFEP